MSTDKMAASVDYHAPRLASEMVVAVEGITRRYGPRIALEKLSLTLREGEVFGLVGPTVVERRPRCEFWPESSNQIRDEEEYSGSM